MSNKNNENKNLYKFLATSYDISVLAKRINATQKSAMGISNLKKMINDANKVAA